MNDGNYRKGYRKQFRDERWSEVHFYKGGHKIAVRKFYMEWRKEKAHKFEHPILEHIKDFDRGVHKDIIRRRKYRGVNAHKYRYDRNDIVNVTVILDSYYKNAYHKFLKFLDANHTVVAFFDNREPNSSPYYDDKIRDFITVSKRYRGHTDIKFMVVQHSTPPEVDLSPKPIPGWGMDELIRDAGVSCDSAIVIFRGRYRVTESYGVIGASPPGTKGYRRLLSEEINRARNDMALSGILAKSEKPERVGLDEHYPRSRRRDLSHYERE